MGVPSRKETAQYWFDRGNSLLNGSAKAAHYESASRCFRRALETDPDFPNAWLRLGISLHEFQMVTEKFTSFISPETQKMLNATLREADNCFDEALARNALEYEAWERKAWVVCK